MAQIPWSDLMNGGSQGRKRYSGANVDSSHLYLFPSAGYDTGAIHWQDASSNNQLGNGFGAIKAFLAAS